MALRPLLLASVVGIAALGFFHAPSAQARGVVSVSVGSPAHYYDQRHRPGHVWVRGHWVRGHRGRVWVPGQYVRVQGYGYGPGRGYGHGGYGGYDGYSRPGVQVIYRSGPGRVVPRNYYPPGYLSPYDNRRPRGW